MFENNLTVHSKLLMIFKNIHLQKYIFLIYFLECLKIFALVQLVLLLMSELDHSKFSEQGNDEKDNVKNQ